MKSLLRFCLLALVLTTLSFGWVTYQFSASGPLEKPTTIIFPPGSHFTVIADTLATQGIISHPFLFKVLVFLRGESSKFKAGEYAFPAQVSARDVADTMAFGKTVVHHLTIPEGLMKVEIFDLVNHADGLDGEITLDVHEGELLPETYNYSRGDKRNDIVGRMQHGMQKALAEAWEGREQGLPLATPFEALTLASIVEKETGLPSERPHVASVYINRLKKGMLLQADPTTAYAVTGGKLKLPRPLTLGDLQMKSPYNTYESPGLPPGPIANPGRASLYAAVHPVQSEDLYFVATGSGGHYFAKTVEEHEKNVHKYRESQRTK